MSFCGTVKITFIDPVINNDVITLRFWLCLMKSMENSPPAHLSPWSDWRNVSCHHGWINENEKHSLICSLACWWGLIGRCEFKWACLRMGQSELTPPRHAEREGGINKLASVSWGNLMRGIKCRFWWENVPKKPSFFPHSQRFLWTSSEKKVKSWISAFCAVRFQSAVTDQKQQVSQLGWKRNRKRFTRALNQSACLFLPHFQSPSNLDNQTL